MKFNKRNNKKNNAIIIGCGRLGSRTAGELSLDDWDVVVMDNNRDAFRLLPSFFGGSTLQANATDIEKLEEAGIKEANLFIAATDNDEINIASAQIAKVLFNVEKVVARIRDQEKIDLCEKYGIKTICPPSLSINEINRYIEV